MKIVTVFTLKRPDTVGVYVNRALTNMGHEIIHVDPFKDGVQRDFDLCLMVDDGHSYEFKERPGIGAKFAYWAIDTHINMEQQVEKSRFADVVFTAQKNAVEKLSKSTGKPTYWLPLACDGEIHTAKRLSKKYDVCFIGNVIPGLHRERIKALEVLFRTTDNFFYGQRFFNDASDIYAESRIVFNCSLENDINMRVFEALASGSLLLTDRIINNGIEDLFDVGIHFDTYGNYDDMAAKVRYYLSHESERERIAGTGMKHAISHHTYRRRMEHLLNILEVKDNG